MIKQKIFLFFSATLCCLIADAETIGYWRFEEGTNAQIAPLYWSSGNHKWFKDSSSNNNNMPTWSADTSPRYTNDKAFNFVPNNYLDNNLAARFGWNTLNDDIWSEGATALKNGSTFSNGWSVEVSVKLFSTTDWQVIVGKDGKPSPADGAPLFSIKFSPALQKFEMNVWDGGTNVRWLSTGDNSVIIKTWYHLACVCDGAAVRLFMKSPEDSQYNQMEATYVAGGPMAHHSGNWSIGRGQWNGANADWANAIIDEVRISDIALLPSQFTAEYQQWSTEEIVTESGDDSRVAISFSAGKANILTREEGEDKPLHYFRQDSNGDFVEHPLGMSHNPNNGDISFAMRTGSDDKIRILSCGPGGSPDKDHILFGTETAPGTATFSWKEIVSENYWANQAGFTLDQNDNAYIAVKHQPSGQCAVFDNAAGSWQSNRFSVIDPSFPRSAIAIDPGNNAWIIFNGRHSGTNYLELWSNRSGSWYFEDYLTNSPEGNHEGCYFIQSVAGFEIKPDGTMAFALKPDWWSSDLEVWFGTLIPEPMMPMVSILFILSIVSKKIIINK